MIWKLFVFFHICSTLFAPWILTSDFCIHCLVFSCCFFFFLSFLTFLALQQPGLNVKKNKKTSIVKYSSVFYAVKEKLNIQIAFLPLLNSNKHWAEWGGRWRCGGSFFLFFFVVGLNWNEGVRFADAASTKNVSPLCRNCRRYYDGRWHLQKGLQKGQRF